MKMGPIDEKWGNFQFKSIEKTDEEKVIEHLRLHFYDHEPMGRLLGCAEDYSKDMDENYKWIFSQGQNLSFMAVDVETGEIAGVQIIYEKSDTLDYSALQGKHSSESMEIVWKIADLAETLPLSSSENNDEAHVELGFGKESNRIAKISSSSVAPKFRGQGLASEMYRRTIQLLKAHEFTSVFSYFTSPETRKIGAKFGFREKSRVVFSELDFTWKNRGERVFSEATPKDFLSNQILHL